MVGSLLVQVGVVTYLVAVHGVLGCRLFCNEHTAVIGVVGQAHVVEGQHGTIGETVGRLVLTCAAEVECPLSNFQSLRSGKGGIELQSLVCSHRNAVPGLVEVVGPSALIVAHTVVPQLGRTGQVTDLGVDLTGLAGSNLCLNGVAVTGVELQLSVTELCVPTGCAAYVHAAVLNDLDTINTICDLELEVCGLCDTGMPRQTNAVIKVCHTQHFARCRSREHHAR